MRVLLIGRHEMLYEAGRRILNETTHEIVAVVTTKSRPEYRRGETDFRKLAKDAGARFLVANKIDEAVLELIQRTKPDIGVSVNWVSIIGASLTDLLPHGVLNAHLGDLPRYRGNAVPNWALLRGEKKVVLTVHRMEPGGLDRGPIVAQRSLPLRPTTTIADIIGFAEAETPVLFQRALDGLASGRLKPRRQRGGPSAGFRCFPRLPRDGLIDWRASATEIDVLVRSLTRPYSGAYTHYRDASGALRRLFVWRTRIVARTTRDLGMPGHLILNDKRSGESHVMTGKGILAIVAASHDDEAGEFAPGKIWKSIRMRLGLSLEDEVYALSRLLSEAKATKT